jgi:Uma2 family endonuclease
VGEFVTIWPSAEPLTVAEYASLGEVEHGYTELLDGRIILSPNGRPDHNVAATEIAGSLRPQRHEDLEVLLFIDIDLQLAPADSPGFSRRPDLIVVQRSALQRVRAQPGLIRASEVEIVVEIVSPGSRRTDHVTHFAHRLLQAKQNGLRGFG